MHKISVQEKYYNMLKAGTKTIELRLFDDKRKLIKKGDVIEFSSSQDAEDKFQATVIGLHRAKNFAELCGVVDVKKTGFATKQELMKVLEDFYTLERQNALGVVGIEISKR